MPITQDDLLPFINNGLVNSNSYLPTNNAQLGSIPTSGGVVPAPHQNNGLLGGFGGAAVDSLIPGAGGIINFASGSGNITDLIDPSGGLGLLSSLFGGGSKGPSWAPYQQNGQYFWNNPKNYNPVPIANVPGARLSPSSVYEKQAQQTQALYDLLPYINAAVNNTAAPTALANLQASQLTSPGYAQLMTQLYNNYGPQLNAIGNEITRRNALAQAGTENAVLTGPGSDLVKNAYNLSQVYDKPYYDTRQLGADSLNKLINSIDLSGGLSNTERNEIGQGLAREGQQRGTQFAPSATDTVSNAMRFGQAGYQRQQQAKSNLSAAISNASAFLPAAKSGVDVFQVATGRPSMPNPGNSLFPGINQSNSSSQYGLAGNILGNMTSIGNNYDNIVANQKDWLDKFNQVASGVSSITSSVGSLAGGAAGFCWIAREIYGNNNPKWKQFRNWMLQDSPLWFFNLYAKYGKRVAHFISNKPKLKHIIRIWMNSKIN